jgi:electron transfer flavoprotein beta subunit
MKIAVCVKHVPVSNGASVDPVTNTLVRDSVEGTLNPADLNAIEEALSIKERFGGMAVAFTMGPPSAEASLRKALAMGVDDAVLMTDRAFAGSDTVATARVLSEGLRRYGPFDLVMTGAASSDGATGQVGPMIAEFLLCPHVTEVLAIGDVGSGRAEAVKKYRGSEVRVSVMLPALFSLRYGCNDPRMPTIRSQLAAKGKNITRCSNDKLSLHPGTLGLDGSPTVVLDSFEPNKRRAVVMLEGDPENIASRILELIREVEKPI